MATSYIIKTMTPSEYLTKRKQQMVRPNLLGASAVNPVTLLGNPARMFPVPLTEPLDMDAALAAAGGITPELQYPFAESPGPYTTEDYACDFQYYLDWTGIANPIAEDIAASGGKPVPPATCQEFATFSGDAFVYLGKTYAPGPWMP